MVEQLAIDLVLESPESPQTSRSAASVTSSVSSTLSPAKSFDVDEAQRDRDDDLSRFDSEPLQRVRLRLHHDCLGEPNPGAAVRPHRDPRQRT